MCAGGLTCIYLLFQTDGEVPEGSQLPQLDNDDNDEIDDQQEEDKVDKEGEAVYG